MIVRMGADAATRFLMKKDIPPEYGLKKWRPKRKELRVSALSSGVRAVLESDFRIQGGSSSWGRLSGSASEYQKGRSFMTDGDEAIKWWKVRKRFLLGLGVAFLIPALIVFIVAATILIMIWMGIIGTCGPYQGPLR